MLLVVARCYGAALNEAESLVITRGFRYWDRICNTWEAYLRWKTRGFPSEARALLSVSHRARTE